MNRQKSLEAVSALDHSAVDQWLDSRSFSPETRRSYRRELYQLEAQLGKSLDAVSAVDLASAIETLVASRPARSARRIASTARSFWSDVQTGGAAREIADALQLPKVDDRDRVAIPADRLTESRVIVLIAMTPQGSRDQVLLRMLYEVPLLPSEIVLLRWVDLHLGRGGKPAVTVHRSGGVEIRRIRVQLWAELLRLRHGAADTDAIFDLSERQIRRVVRAAGERAKLPDLTPRELRDAHAVHASRKGASDAAVRKALGGVAIGPRRARAAGVAAYDETPYFLPHFSGTPGSAPRRTRRALKRTPGKRPLAVPSRAGA